MQFNTTDESTFRTVLYRALQNLPRVTDAGYTGYGIVGGSGFAAIFLQPKTTEQGFNRSFAPIYELAAHPNVSEQMTSFPTPTWIDCCNAFSGDPIIDFSRLLTANVLMNRTTDLIDLVLEFSEFSADFNFSMLSLPPLTTTTCSY
jgi:hypothetical protein